MYGDYYYYLVFSLMLGLAFILGTLMKKIRLSASIGYLFAGLILSFFLHIPSDLMDLLAFFSEISIILLFFEIGFEVHIDNIGKIAGFPTYLSLLELVLALSMTLGLCSFLGIDTRTALIYGLMAAFSSTVFTYKLLEEKMPTRSEVKETVLMVAAVEDIIIVTVLAVMSSGGNNVLVHILYTVAVGIALFILSYEFTKKVLDKIISVDDNGLILLISYGLLISTASSVLGLSSALGAFIAGLTASHIKKSNDLMKLFKPIRFIFLTLFLISMGMNMFIYKTDLQTYVLSIGIGLLIVFVHVITTITSSIIAGGLGLKYGLETGFYLSTSSELSLVIAYYASMYMKIDLPLVLTASIAIITGSIVSSKLTYGRDHYIPLILRKISYEKYSIIDNTLLRIREFINKHQGKIYSLFKQLILNLGELLISTLIMGALLSIIHPTTTSEAILISFFVIIVYVTIFLRVYKRTRNILYKMLLETTKSINDLQLRIIDRIYASLVIITTILLSFITIYVIHRGIYNVLADIIDPKILFFIALFVVPLAEIIFILYELWQMNK